MANLLVHDQMHTIATIAIVAMVIAFATVIYTFVRSWKELPTSYISPVLSAVVVIMLSICIIFAFSMGKMIILIPLGISTTIWVVALVMMLKAYLHDKKNLSSN